MKQNSLKRFFPVLTFVIAGLVLLPVLRGSSQEADNDSTKKADRPPELTELSAPDVAEPQELTKPLPPAVVAEPQELTAPPPSNLTGGGRILAGTSLFPQNMGVLSANNNSARVVSSGRIMISWSRENDELRGFSVQSGEWTKLKIKKLKAVVPIVGGHVAAVRVSDSVAAYSGKTGTWDLLKLRPESAAVPTVSDEVVQVSDGEELYTFAASKGQWTSPTDPNFLPRTTVYVVRHILPEVAKQRIESTFKGKDFKTAVGEKGVIVLAATSIHDGIASLLKEIDQPGNTDPFQQPSASTARPAAPLVRRPAAALSNPNPIVGGTLVYRQSTADGNREVREFRVRHMKAIEALMRLETELQNAGVWGFNVKQDRFEIVGTKEQLNRIAERLKEVDTADGGNNPFGTGRTGSVFFKRVESTPRFTEQGQPARSPGSNPAVIGLPGVVRGTISSQSAEEKKSLQLAQQLRSAGTASDEQKKELQDLVTQALNKRLWLQEQQVAQLKEKLEKVEKALTQRQQSKDRIIERRVEELLDPDVDWEVISRPTGSRPSAIRVSATPIGIPGPAYVQAGQPTAPSLNSGTSRSKQETRQPQPMNTPVVSAVSGAVSSQHFVNDLIQRRRAVEKGRQKVEEAVASAQKKASIQSYQQELKNLMAEWKLSWNQYLSYLRVQEFKVEEKKNLVSFADTKHQTVKKQVERGINSKIDLSQAEAEVRQSEIRLRQAEEQLSMVKSIAKDSPHLNPESMDLNKLLSEDSQPLPPDPPEETTEPEAVVKPAI